MILKDIVDAITPADNDEKDARTVLERKFDGVVDLSDEEISHLAELQSESNGFAANKDVVEAGEPADLTLILIEGWAYRYKTLEDGKRQIVSFLIPGDFVNLYAALFDEADTSVRTLTDCQFAGANPDQMLEIFKTEPRLAALLCWSAGEHDAILAEQIVRIGRRSAYERIAHLVMELLIRLEHVDQSSGDSFEFPLTQEVIGDTLGLSTVHVNRTMKRLRNDGLIEQNNGRIAIKDTRALADAAQFDRDYLERRRVPHSLMSRIFDS
ncbi:MAG: Crp/Fnr family transcriptional regulator [Alphaproteobacteria bacterium]|nr:Crp/Fnr family transcriptional regulator [Alphaproteobacteria bacterium]